MAVPGKSVLYVLLNGLTVTQTSTSETDGYLRGKGQWQSLPPFSSLLCHVVLFEGDKLAATTQQCRQKHFCLSLQQGVEESLTLMVCDGGNWTMIGCEMSGFLCGD